MEKKFNVSGMTCMHCVASVKGAVGKISGVKSVDVSDDKKIVTVQFDAPADEAMIREAIEDTGFDVE